MVKYKTLLRVIEEDVVKCHTTIKEMHLLLDQWDLETKHMLLRYAMGIDYFDNDGIYEYAIVLRNGTEEEIFQFERQIFDKITKKRRDNLFKYCEDFNTEDYKEDYDVGYPSNRRGDVEHQQEQIQEQRGYPDNVKEAVNVYWTNGFFSEIQDYVEDGTFNKENVPEPYKQGIKNSADAISGYIDESEGLEYDTVLYRGGHWDKNTKVGDVKSTPVLNSTSFSERTAYTVGITDQGKEDGYLIKVYAPKGTKGLMVNAPSLAHDFPEHEYLLGKGQKYIVLDVDDVNKTATVKLIND